MAGGREGGGGGGYVRPEGLNGWLDTSTTSLTCFSKEISYLYSKIVKP